MTIAIEIDRHDRTSVRISGPHAFAAGETYDPLVLLHADGLSPSTLRVLLRRPGVPGMPVVSSASGFRSATRSEIRGVLTLCTEEMASWCADALGFSESDVDPLAVPVSAEARLEVYDGDRLAASSRVPVVLRWMTPGMDPAAEGTSTATALDAYPVRDPDPGAPRRALVTSDGVARAISDALGALDPSAVGALAERLAALEGSDSDVSAREIARSEVAALVDGAPEALDTLKEIADRLGSEGDALAALVSDVAALKAAGGEANVQADWSESDPSSDAFIRGKPALKPVATSGSYLDLADRPTVDSALSPTSANPVQNMVVAGALAEKVSRAEVEAGFTEWAFSPATFEGKVCSAQFEGGNWYLYLDGSMTEYADSSPETATSLNFMGVNVTATRVRLPTMADIPTVAEDIGAQPAGSYATAAQGARADAALSHAEVEAGFTEWRFYPPAIDGKVCSVVYDDQAPGWVLYLDGEATSDTLPYAEDATHLVFDDNYSVEAVRIRLPGMSDIPTKTSDLVNDGPDGAHPFLTSHQDITGKADKSEMSVTPGTGSDADKTTIQLKTGTSATVLTQHQSLAGLMPMYPFEAGTFVGAHWTFSSGSLVPGRHFEIIFDSTDSYWYLLDFPDSSTFDPSEDISNYDSYINDEAQGTAADTSVTFSTANVTATLVPNTLTVSPFKVNGNTPASGASFTVAMGELPDGVTDVARDAVLVIDCSSLGQNDTAPTVTWPQNFHPRTDIETDLAIVDAGKRAVFYISEYASGEFAVGGWVETEGGYDPDAQSGGSGT